MRSRLSIKNWPFLLALVVVSALWLSTLNSHLSTVSARVVSGGGSGSGVSSETDPLSLHSPDAAGGSVSNAGTIGVTNIVVQVISNSSITIKAGGTTVTIGTNGMVNLGGASVSNAANIYAPTSYFQTGSGGGEPGSFYGGTANNNSGDFIWWPNAQLFWSAPNGSDYGLSRMSLGRVYTYENPYHPATASSTNAIWGTTHFAHEIIGHGSLSGLSLALNQTAFTVGINGNVNIMEWDTPHGTVGTNSFFVVNTITKAVTIGGPTAGTFSINSNLVWITTNYLPVNSFSTLGASAGNAPVFDGVTVSWGSPTTASTNGQTLLQTVGFGNTLGGSNVTGGGTITTTNLTVVSSETIGSTLSVPTITNGTSISSSNFVFRGQQSDYNDSTIQSTVLPHALREMTNNTVAFTGGMKTAGRLMNTNNRTVSGSYATNFYRLGGVPDWTTNTLSSGVIYRNGLGTMFLSVGLQVVVRGGSAGAQYVYSRVYGYLYLYGYLYNKRAYQQAKAFWFDFRANGRSDGPTTTNTVTVVAVVPGQFNYWLTNRISGNGTGGSVTVLGTSAISVP